LWLIQVLALAAPVSVPIQGSLSSIDGARAVTFHLRDAATGTDGFHWSALQTVAFADGAFSTDLGVGGALTDDTFLDHPALWVSIEVDGAESDRVPVGRVPYAITATNADRLAGEDPSAFARAAAASIDWSWLDGASIPEDVLAAPAAGDGLIDDVANGEYDVDAAWVQNEALGVCPDTTEELQALLDGVYVAPGDDVTLGHLTLTDGLSFTGSGDPYLNFGATTGAGGFGIRSSNGLLQYKNSGDTDWVPLSSPPASAIGGTGDDGSLTVTSTFDITATRGGTTRPGTVADGVVFAASAVATNTITTTTSVAGLTAGDKILLYFAQATSDTSDVGSYDLLTVSTASGTTITVSEAVLASRYDSGSSKKILVQRVPQYTNVTVQSGGTITASAWDGLTSSSNGVGAFRSGVVAFLANGTLTVASGGKIDVSKLGFRTGTSGGAGPESFAGTVTTGGGTGETGCDWSTCWNGGRGANDAGGLGGGGGGNFQAAGTAGGLGQGGGGAAGSTATGPSPRNGGAGGGPGGGGGGGGSADYEANGNNDAGGGGGGAAFDNGSNPTPADLSKLMFGGGASQGAGGGGGMQPLTGTHAAGQGGNRNGAGGAGGAGTVAANGGAGGAGEPGGGLVFVRASTATINGAISANGGVGGAGGAGGGSNGEGGHGGGGEGGQGASAGAIHLTFGTASLGNNSLLSLGGNGGAGGVGSNGNGNCAAGAGGAGATFSAGNDLGGGGGGGGNGTWRACGGGGSGGKSGQYGKIYLSYQTITGSPSAAANPDPYVPADLAEWMPAADRGALSAGDLVAIDGRGGRAVVRKSAGGAYDPEVIGVVSGGPDLTISREDRLDSVPVALAGRVYVRVIGPVTAGDAITAAAVPGFAMRADRAGRIVGYALEPRLPDSDRVLVFVNPQWWSGARDGAVRATRVEAMSELALPRFASGDLPPADASPPGAVVFVTDRGVPAVSDGREWRLIETRPLTEPVARGR
jgi:hypothetical protein